MFVTPAIAAATFAGYFRVQIKYVKNRFPLSIVAQLCPLAPFAYPHYISIIVLDLKYHLSYSMPLRIYAFGTNMITYPNHIILYWKFLIAISVMLCITEFILILCVGTHYG